MSVVVEFVKLALMDCPYAQLSFDGGNQWWSLKQSSGKGLECSRELCLSTWKLVMKSNDTNIFLPGTLLRFDQSSRTVYTHDEAARDFGVESSTMASFLDSEF